MKYALYSAAALAAGAFPVMGEVYPLEEITLSVGLEETSTDRTGVTVIVADEEDLQETGDRWVVDYLGQLPGITITPKGGVGQTSGLMLRGANQNYFGMLVDGIDVTDPTGTQVAYDFGQLGNGGIGRLEVLKGAQSALYGSRAVAGVISVNSRRPTEEGTRHFVDFGGGSYATQSLSYGLTHRSGPIDLAFNLSRFKTDGISAADENDGNTEADGFETNRLSFSASYRLDSGARIGMAGFAEKSDIAYDEGFPLGDGTPDEMSYKTSGGLRLFGTFTTGAVDHEVSAQIFKVKRRYVESNGFGPSDYTYEGQRRKLAYQGGVDLSNAARLVFGTDWMREDYDQSGSFGVLEAKTTISGLFAELTYSPNDQLDLSAALRRDDHSDAGAYTTGRVAVAWRPGNDVILRAQAGTGFRAPSNFELYDPIAGSRGLQPEESRNVDIGIEKRFGAGFIRATGFWLEVDNLIDYDFGTNKYDQIPGASRRKGIELEGEYAMGERLTFGASYVLTDSATNASSSWARVARHVINMNLHGDLGGGWGAGMGLTHAADRGALPDYTVADATVTYQINNSAEAYLRIENLFDEEYQLVPGYGTSDRAAFFGLRASF